MGRPENIDDYEEYDVDGIKVFVKLDVDAKDNQLKVKHSKILWNEKLVVDGMLF